LLGIENEFSDPNTSVTGYDYSRVAWVNYNENEGLIPTMYEGDKMIYISQTYIPTKYYIEKFFDEGYTVGVAGLYQDSSGNYRYTSDNCVTMSTSDMTGLEDLDAESIYLITANGEPIDSTRISKSGTIFGLTLMDTYEIDIRTGTEQVLGTVTCNVHYFASAETYTFTSFEFITPYVAELGVPDYLTAGYYEIGGKMFRYAADAQDYHNLTQDDYNTTIFLYSDEGKLIGTNIGLVFNSEGLLVENDGGTIYPDGTIGAYLEKAGVDIYSLADELQVDEDELYDHLNYDESNFSVLDVDTVKSELRSMIINKQLMSGELTVDDLEDQYEEKLAEQEAASYQGELCYIEDNGDLVTYDGGQYCDIKYTDRTTGSITMARLYIADDDFETCVPVNLHSYYIITQASTHDDYEGLEIVSATEAD
jgi:hypothetical protein